MKLNVLAFFALVAAATTGETDAKLTREEKLAFETKIVGGTPVGNKDQYPWVASIQTRADGAYCGASLIGKRWVLTAAHCIEYAVPQTVVLKQLNLVGSTSGRVVRNVEGATIHPKYDSFSMVNDVALIKLKEPIDNIEPIALAFPEDYKTGLETKALGWGTTSSGGSPSDVLRIVTVPLVSHSVCTARPSYPGEIDQATMICAGYPAGGKDSCQGDSGGPLMHQGTNGAAKLYGVVSWGEGCASKNKYGVYARVSAYHSWIKTTTKGEVDPEQPTDGPTDPGAPTSSPTLSPPPTDPLNGWEGWLVERNFCRKFKRTRCNREPRCEFKKIEGMASGARCYPSRAICLPE